MGGEQLEAANRERPILRREAGHGLGDEIRGRHLADPGDHVASRFGQPDEDPTLVALVADPGDEPLALQALQQFRDGVASQPQMNGLFADRQRAAGREMLQHLQRAVGDGEIPVLNPIGPVVPPVDLRQEAGDAPGSLLGR